MIRKCLKYPKMLKCDVMNTSLSVCSSSRKVKLSQHHVFFIYLLLCYVGLPSIDFAVKV